MMKANLASREFYKNSFGRSTTFSPAIPSEPTFTAPPLNRNDSALSMPDIKPTDSIINRRDGLDTSLYQICVRLRKRLALVPGFERWLDEMDQEEQESEDDTDPVTLMWNTLRRGEPLLDIYNALQPRTPLTMEHAGSVASVSHANIGKKAAFKFLQACMNQLGFPSPECFLITDLYGSDTTGFVKVLKVIERVLNEISRRGLMSHPEEQSDNTVAANATRSYRDNVINELVTTERDYVSHLETLQAFKNLLEQSGAIAGDIIHDIFLNLNSLLDFQRRFLIRIEQQNNLDKSVQDWGLMFKQYSESFQSYEPFIANQNSKGNDTIVREFEKIKAVAPVEWHTMVDVPATLQGFILKPFQRISKYPLLLDDLQRKGEYDDEKTEHIKEGSEAMKAVLRRIDSAMDRAKMDEEVVTLLQLVDDWKGHKLEQFGRLVLNGTFPVLKGEGSKETSEREYKIYLFERILLCCKELNPKKEKNRLAGKGLDKKGRPKLQLKGRIFIQNVTDLVSTAKSDHHTMQIWWKGDPGIETFIVKFRLPSDKDKWSQTIQELRVQLKMDRQATSAGVSQTEFISMSGLGEAPPNPYRQQDEDYDDDDLRFSQATTLNSGSGSSYPEYSSSRNASNASLRSRSTTGGSGNMALVNRGVPPPRFPLPEPHMPYGAPGLKVATNIDEPGTPDERFASHFSPTGDSPNSMRSSSQAGMYPFPRQHTPSNSGWPPQDNSGNKHNTAPPMHRGPFHEDEPGHGVNNRTIQRPSLPAMTASQQQAAFAQSRARSLSSPDVHNPQNPVRRLPNGQLSSGMEEVPVPSIPAHLASMRAPVNRSQNNSPTEATRGMRGQTQSPNMIRPPQQYPTNYGYDQYPPRINGYPQQPMGAGRVLSPPLSAGTLQPEASTIQVSQLKVKVHFEPKPSHVTIVVPVIIKHRSLIDRIDSKMEKVSAASIAKGTARLRYRDSEGELVLIENDDDVQMAIEDWQEGHEQHLKSNMIPDFDLFWKENAAGYARTPA